ncbi:class I SAM-dependent methyltransferase [Actinoplanes friuliensis]|uniref:Methyltransferase type 12 n=1 Tax=Actinoplanes friuliensis DSM 7358 TaxID=1246995 RepID=U5VQ73_9ACTN|nr:methyltransferase domain-containing protein [Actinoplanes friuliensis]AGZ38967.1 methyltransferase type 12 [Actinoplanes friuliensis DSM 7358]
MNPDRVRGAIEVIAPAPGDELLEIGCGPGVAAGLVCERLTTGRLLAIDRSAVAVGRTTRRNAAHVDAGRLEVRRSSLGELTAERQVFVTAYAMDVNVFWTTPGAGLDVLAGVIRPGGRLLILYGGDGPTSADRITSTVASAVRATGFADVRVLGGEWGIGVSARAR